MTGTATAKWVELDQGHVDGFTPLNYIDECD